MTFRDTTEIEKIREAYHRCDEPGEVLIEKAYTAGLRRAQELAKKHVYAWGDEVDAEQGLCADIGVSFDAFDRAIDAEAAKERT